MRSGNPSLRPNTFDNYSNLETENVMTIQGTVNKTFILLAFVLAAAAYSWYQYFTNQQVTPYIMIGAFGGLIVGLIVTFWKRSAPVLAPVYAILEGLFVGAISALFESSYSGITLMAIVLTFSVLLSLLLAYKSRLIKVTQNFRLGIIAATGGIFLTYLLSLILSFFGIQIPFIHDSGPIGIIVSIVIVIIAALNLVLDFDFIENGSRMNCPKFMEWYGAFGLMVTLIWLYLEILRLLAKIFASRNN